MLLHAGLVRRKQTKCTITHLFSGWKNALTTGASKRIVQYLCGGSSFEARSQTTTFQSREAVNKNREFRDQLFTNVSLKPINERHFAHDNPVTVLTWPSKCRTTAWVARSQSKALPSRRPAATKRPVQSKRAITAPESRVARTVVGRF
jgi:hypothetical protein